MGRASYGKAWLWAAAVGVAVGLAAPDAEAQGVRSLGYGRKDKDKEPQRLPNAKATKVFPSDSTWIAVSLNGKSFTGERPSFILDKQFRAKGFGGCNSFAATAFPLLEQHLAVGPLALTKRSCDKPLMSVEQSFLVALRTASQWDIVGSNLVLKGQGGEIKFERSL